MSISIYLAKFITAIPALSLWVSVAFSLGVSLMISICETIYYVNRQGNWKAYTQKLQKMLQIILIPCVASLLLTAFVCFFNWQGAVAMIPALTSSVSLGAEGGLVVIEALLLLASFKGWEKLNAKHHLTITWLAGIGLGLCMWWPVAISAWMECPLGTIVNLSNFTLQLDNLLWVILSPLATCKFFHMLTASWVVGGALFLVLNCKELVSPSSVVGKWCVCIGIIVTFLGLVLAMCMGDRTGYNVALQQPMKMAVIQNLQKGSKHAPFEILGPVRISDMLSRLATHSDFGFVPGVQDVIEGGYALPEGGVALSLKQKHALAENLLKKSDKIGEKSISKRYLSYESQYIGYKNLQEPQSITPSLTLYYWAFRLMIGSSLLILALLILISYGIIKKNIKSTILTRCCSFVLPLSICSYVCGWIISNFGKYPWVVADLLTEDSAITDLSHAMLYAELTIVVLITVFMVVWAYKKVRMLM